MFLWQGFLVIRILNRFEFWSDEGFLENKSITSFSDLQKIWTPRLRTLRFTKKCSFRKRWRPLDNWTNASPPPTHLRSAILWSYKTCYNLGPRKFQGCHLKIQLFLVPKSLKHFEFVFLASHDFEILSCSSCGDFWKATTLRSPGKCKRLARLGNRAKPTILAFKASIIPGTNVYAVKMAGYYQRHNAIVFRIIKF